MNLDKIDFAFFDVDGTLTDDGGKIQQELLEIISVQNFLPILCTGRSIDRINRIWKKFNLSKIFYGKVVCHDGNCILDMKKMQYKILKYISFKDFTSIMNNNQRVSDWVIACPNKLITSNRSAEMKYKMTYLTIPKLIERKTVEDLKACKKEMKILSIYFFPDTTKKVSVSNTVEIEKKNMPMLNAYRFEPKISKAAGMRYLLKEYFNRDDLKKVLSFGDAMNDLEMLQESEYGVCMDRAPNQLIAISDIYLKNKTLTDFLRENYIKKKGEE